MFWNLFLAYLIRRNAYGFKCRSETGRPWATARLTDRLSANVGRISSFPSYLSMCPMSQSAPDSEGVVDCNALANERPDDARSRTRRAPHNLGLAAGVERLRPKLAVLVVVAPHELVAPGGGQLPLSAAGVDVRGRGAVHGGLGHLLGRVVAVAGAGHGGQVPGVGNASRGPCSRPAALPLPTAPHFPADRLNPDLGLSP